MIRLVCLPIALMLCWGSMGWMSGGCSDNGGTEQDAGQDAQDAGFDAGADQGGDEQEVDAGHDAGADEGADLEFDAGVDVEVDPCEGVECEDPCAVYVDLNVAAPGDGSTPGTALTDVQAGIDTAAELAGDCCTCEVRVAQGTYWAYKETAYDGFALSERVDLLGGYPTGFGEDPDPVLYETILDGHKDPEGGVPDDAFRVFHVLIAADLLTIDGFTITGGNAQDDDSEYNPNNYGGGIINLEASPTVSRCHITGNQAMHGAGMYNSESTSLIETCLFELNAASRAGGGMLNRAGNPRVVDCQFLNNTGGMGAGVYNGGATVATFTTSAEGTCSFEGNTATIYGGGMDNEDCSVTVENCVFTGNSAPEGGGMSNRWVADGLLSNLTFSLNSADNGGGMLNRHGSTVVIVGDLEGGCLFENNQAVNFGGAMANFDSSPVISNCTFTGNDAIEGGGIYSTEGGELSISGEQGSCLFDANTAWLYGGAVSGRGVTLSLTGCTLQGSEITYADPWSPDYTYWGGAIYSLNNTITLSDCTFSHNKCNIWFDEGGFAYYEGRAGAAWIEGGTAEITDCVFQSNQAGWTGAAVEIRECNATVTDSQFLQNQILETGGAGGGMYVSQSTARLERCIFQANTTPLTDGTWESIGGALDSSNTNLTVRNTIFDANLSDYSAIFIGGTAPASFEGCVIKDNHGYLSAGAISHTGNNLTLTNCTLVGNTAAADCSVMWLGDAHATFHNSIIWGNHGSAGSLPLFAGILSHSVTINHSDVQGGHAGNNNVNVDPLLDANSQPQATSPAEIIDSGDNSLVTLEEDLAGAPRIHNNIVDMGAYEWQGGAK